VQELYAHAVRDHPAAHFAHFDVVLLSLGVRGHLTNLSVTRFYSSLAPNPQPLEHALLSSPHFAVSFGLVRKALLEVLLLGPVLFLRCISKHWAHPEQAV